MKTYDLKTAFSLIELLIVIAIMSILMALVLPATNSLLNASKLDHNGRRIADEILLARQKSLSLNRNVGVRFIRKVENQNYTAVQVFISTEDGVSESAVGRPVTLDEGLSIQTEHTLSPIFSKTKPETTVTDNSLGKIAYTSFRIRPNGETDIDSAISSSFFTLVLDSAYKPGTTPNNYYTVQIDPTTSRANTYRP